ncbi:MAG: CehA/McbA family metallohydrolase [Psychrilyobacter sp.]|uniref:CehA/McbA family metallohydrolase n=1 Tax=Psychrilyobacter sp. TaxID=2586924 RepID=UPI003C766D44
MKLRKELNSSKVLREKVLIEGIKENIVFEFNVDNGHVNIFIKDPAGTLRVQYVNGRAPEKVLLSKKKSFTSVGTYPGELPSGEWEFIFINFEPVQGKREGKVICIVKIEKDAEVFEGEILRLDDGWTDHESSADRLKLKYNYQNILSNKRRWYKGDFHTHTQLSDGHMSPTIAMDMAQNIQDMDFFVITDHNMLNTGFKSGEVLVIPGVEVTSPMGHFNILGAKDERVLPIEREMDLDYVEEIMDRAKEQEALCSINHSMMDPWHWQFEDLNLEKIDTLEICCDPTFSSSPSSTEKALNVIDILWNEGYKIYGVGGSDCHLLPTERYKGSNKPSLYGDPGTYVLSENLSANEVLKAVKMGRIYVSRDVKLFPEIIGEKIYYPGEEVFERNLKYQISVREIVEEIEILLIIDGKTTEKRILIKDGEVNFNLCLEGNYSWVRAEIRNVKGDFLGYINPVYFGKKEKEVFNWKQVLEKMEERQ